VGRQACISLSTHLPVGDEGICPGSRQYIHVTRRTDGTIFSEGSGRVSCSIVLSYDSFSSLETWCRLTYCPLSEARGKAAAENGSSFFLSILVCIRLRDKIPLLEQTLQGKVTGHHRFMLKALMDHLAYLESQIERLNQRIEEAARPFAKGIAAQFQLVHRPARRRTPAGRQGLTRKGCHAAIRIAL
jgi:hypothetical protein